MAGASAWTRSLPSTDAMAELVRERYGLAVTRAVLVRSLVNDVYRVDGPDGGYALKVYGAGRSGTDEVRREQQLADHLWTAGVPVATGVPLADGDTVSVLDAPEGPRVVALTQWVPGAGPTPPWTDDLFRAVGAALARLHLAADGFGSELLRQPARSGSAAAVVDALDGSPNEQELVRTASLAARQHLAVLGGQGLRRGVRHGDPSLDNIHLDGGRVWFYDFDLATVGWQVEDLTGALSTDHADAFLSAYTALRPLSAADVSALPWLRITAIIDNLHFHLVDKPRFAGTDSLGEGWVDDNLRALATSAAELGL